MAFVKQRNQTETNSFSDIGKPEQILIRVLSKIKIVHSFPRSPAKITALKLFGCFFTVLFLGWYMMVSHLDGDTFRGVVELPLKESYANPVYALALMHWVIGIPSVIVFLIVMAKGNQSEFMTSCFYSVPIFLMSLGFTIQYIVLLIKVGAESFWWVYVVAAVLDFLIANL
jgi:hypothetical protein